MWNRQHDRDGIAFYVNLDDCYEGDYLWIAIRWEEGGELEIYRVKLVSNHLQARIVEEKEEIVIPEEPETSETPDTPAAPEIPTVPEPAAPTDRDNGDKDTSGPASAPAASEAPSAPAEAPAAPAAPEAADPAPETTGETTKAEVAAATTDANGAAKAEVSGTSMNQAIEAAVTEAVKQGTKPVVEIEVQTAAEAKSLNVELPAASLKTLAAAENASLAINSGVAAVTLDHSALSALAGAATGSTVTLEVVSVAAEALNDAQKAAVGEGTITVSLPYALADGVDAADIVVCFLAEDGALTPCETSYEDGQVTFVTTHLGEYVIGSAK